MRAVRIGWMGLVIVLGSAASAAAQEAQCFPACRDGFLCHQGQCISACNPACPEGQVCAGSGTCVPAHAYTPPPAAGQPAQPAPYGQQPTQPAPYGQQPAPYGQQPAPYGPPAQPGWGAPPGQPQPAQPGWGAPPGQPGYVGPQSAPQNPDRGADRVRFALSPIVIGFEGRLGFGDFDYDAATTFGVALSMDRAIGRFFAIGGGLRTIFYQGEGAEERAKGLDVFVLPRIRHGFGIAEVYLAVPVGVAIDFLPDAPEVNPGVGYTVSPLLGAQVFATDSLGFFAEIGGILRSARFTDELDSANVTIRQGAFNIGLAFVF